MNGMTKKELATIVGYSYHRLYDIDKELPENKKLFVNSQDGKYDLAVFVQRWVEYSVSQADGGGDEDLDTVKARHEVIKAEKTQLEVDRMRGQLIDVADVKKLWGDIASTVSTNFCHLPSKIAPMLVMLDNVDIISGILDAEIRTVLNAIADTPLPEYAADEAKEEDEDDEEV